jgi:hypothetical protein
MCATFHSNRFGCQQLTRLGVVERRRHNMNQTPAMVAQRMLDMDGIAVAFVRAKIADDRLKGVKIGRSIAHRP